MSQQLTWQQYVGMQGVLCTYLSMKEAAKIIRHSWWSMGVGVNHTLLRKGSSTSDVTENENPPPLTFGGKSFPETANQLPTA